MMKRIPYARPSITQVEIDAVNDALVNGIGPNYTRHIDRFEREFAEKIGVKYALATSSCTGALHIGMKALGIQKGDEVILADSNWVATMAPILYLDAIPRLVDVDTGSWCIDADEIKSVLTTYTQAIVVTHLYGNVAEMDKIMMIADRYGVPVIEDCAEAIGACCEGKHVGSMGKFGVFSFHGSKTISTGEGGMLVTNDEELYERCKILADHGRVEGGAMFTPEMLGFKYKMTAIQAAMGSAQLSRWDELVEDRRGVCAMYRSKLRDLPITMNQYVTDKHVPAYWMPTIVWEDGVMDKGSLLRHMDEAGIDARTFFPPLSSLKFTRKYGPVRNDRAKYLFEHAINLPSYYGISVDEIDRICDVIRKEMGR